MITRSGSLSVAPPPDGLVVTIGNFDGVHLGHQALLRAALARAAALGVPCAVFTFDPAPRDVLRPGNGVTRIQSLEDRLAQFERLGVDLAVVEPTTPALLRAPADEFAREILGRRLRAREVVLGWDFRFGAGREGNAGALGETLGVPVHTIEPTIIAGSPASSSRIRQAIRVGDLALAHTLLGRPHTLVGPVLRGDQRGRALGWRTANIQPQTATLPPDGVYAVRVLVAPGVRMDGVANLGTHPTFGGENRALEVHLFGEPGDLYGATLTAELIAPLREERRFANREALVAQIERDVSAAREVLARTSATGVFMA